MAGNEEQDGSVWFYNAESFKIPGDGSVVPLLFYNGHQRVVIGEAEFQKTQVEFRFNDSIGAEHIKKGMRIDLPMSFSLDRAEISDLRGPVFPGSFLASMDEAEKLSIETIFRIRYEPATETGEANGTAD